MSDDDWGEPCSEPPVSDNDTFVRSNFAVPADERCVDYYSCALQQTILMHGFAYVTYSYLCFYSNILGIVTQETIPLSDVTRIDITTQAFINPGIVVCTGDMHYEFFSFIDRDLAFERISNICRFQQLNFVKPCGHDLQVLSANY